jgi:hypothetical protein
MNLEERKMHAKMQFVGNYFIVEGFESIYLCSSVDLDESNQVMSITFFNRFRHNDLEPQSLTFGGDAKFVRILDQNLIARHLEHHDTEMA